MSGVNQAEIEKQWGRFGEASDRRARSGDDFQDLTLGELEELAERFAAAVKTIRDAQELLGIAPKPRVTTTSAELNAIRQVQDDIDNEPPRVRPPSDREGLTPEQLAERDAAQARRHQFTPAEQAERAALLAKIRPPAEPEEKQP